MLGLQAREFRIAKFRGGAKDLSDCRLVILSKCVQKEDYKGFGLGRIYKVR